jgi:hypothetical protein
VHPISSNTLKDLKTHINPNTVLVRDLSPIDMSSKPKIDKEILELIDTINQMIN